MSVSASCFEQADGYIAHIAEECASGYVVEPSVEGFIVGEHPFFEGNVAKSYLSWSFLLKKVGRIAIAELVSFCASFEPVAGLKADVHIHAQIDLEHKFAQRPAVVAVVGVGFVGGGKAGFIGARGGVFAAIDGEARVVEFRRVVFAQISQRQSRDIHHRRRVGAVDGRLGKIYGGRIKCHKRGEIL